MKRQNISPGMPGELRLGKDASREIENRPKGREMLKIR